MTASFGKFGLPPLTPGFIVAFRRVCACAVFETQTTP